MEWVDRYLIEVGRYLPETKRDDALDALRDAIEGELDGVTEAQDRALTASDEKAVLERFGHPLKVAQGYHNLPYLIGPALYPTWWHTVKQFAVIVLAVQLLLGLLLGLATDWRIGAWDMVGMLITGQVWSFAITTAIFAAMEHSGQRLTRYDNWRADQLPAQSVTPIKRSDVFTNMLTEGVFLLWWNDILDLARWLPDSIPEFPLQPGPALDAWFWPLNIIVGLAFALHLWVWLRGVWQRPTLWAEILGGLALIGVLLAMVFTGDLIVARELPSTGATQFMERVSDSIQWTIDISLLVVAAVAAWDVWLAWRRVNATSGLA